MTTKDNKISLGNARFNPAAFQGVVFTPQQQNMSLLQHSIDKLDERKEKTDTQAAAIMEAINKVRLDSSENKWKQDYVNRIKNEINAAAQFGDYSSALETATRLAGEAIHSPELSGRQRYYEEREKWLEELKNRRTRGEINSDTYNRAVAQNAYNYSDTYDDNGNVTGGISWNPAFNPVNDLDFSKIRDEIKAFITPNQKTTSRKGGTSQVYLDKDGNQTTNINDARRIFYTKTGGESSHSKTGVSSDQWAAAYDVWLSQHPEAIPQFEQQMQNVMWNIEQYRTKSKDTNISQDEQKIANETADKLDKTLRDKSGALLSPEKYARSLVDPMFEVMAYTKTVDSSEDGSILFNEEIGKNRITADILGLSTAQAEIYSNSSPIEQYDILKNAANTAAGLTVAGQRALNELTKKFGNSSYGGYTAPWSDYKTPKTN
ncbi:hypothetical protein [Clostridium sp.]|uniref:hypothetical protein n=1 Tax=Clostridium sp. TaxID=1506 RepID=UPI0025BACFBE|nr:hypothetical protein [Clostridium sp.]